jgi:tagatose-1,6-bisphosphate aldolase non-catalytic subunit AgaZ/GatZ
MIKARPNLNGNTAADFQAVIDSFTDAMEAVGNARRLLMGDVLNGRNYQHLAAPQAVMAADRTVYAETMVAILEQLDSARNDIYSAMEGHA